MAGALSVGGVMGVSYHPLCSIMSDRGEEDMAFGRLVVYTSSCIHV
jgi:hypothetical protein